VVHSLQRQLDRLGFAGVGHAGGAMEGGDAGDIATAGRAISPGVAAPGGEDRHVGAQRPLGVAGIGTPRRRRVALQIGQRPGLDFGR
jgi:hypothetical protein